MAGYPHESKHIYGELAFTFFNLIMSGHKTIEGRLNTGKWSTLKVGDTITFTRKKADGTLTNDHVEIRVTNLTRYSTFREMLTQEGLRRVLPGLTTVEDGVELYKTWYSIADQVTYGVLALEIQII
jgi:ASC-1-like (ASCH) protein